MRCTHCSHQNKDGSKFCTFCGNNLADKAYVVGHLRLFGGAEKREYIISDVERYIGRDATNDIVVDDEEMSFRHARIWLDNGGIWVEDLDSTNGTFVNGKRIVGPVLLSNEDLVRIGRTLLQLLV